jgi:hypothetical protein
MEKEGFIGRIGKFFNRVIEGGQPQAQSAIDETVARYVSGYEDVHSSKASFQAVAEQAKRMGGKHVPDIYGGVAGLPDGSYVINNNGRIDVVDLRGVRSGKKAMQRIAEKHGKSSWRAFAEED